jgi:hypothetical protein
MEVAQDSDQWRALVLEILTLLILLHELVISRTDRKSTIKHVLEILIYTEYYKSE